MSKVDGTKPEPIDLLEGAAAIAEYLFGDASQRRRVYHAAANTDLPIFKLSTPE